MKLAIWYHCKISGEGVPSEDFAVNIVAQQMYALRQSGLSAAASEFHIGVNGTDSDALTVCSLAPGAPILHVHGPSARTEIPTQNILRAWLPGHEDWFVLYHHSKGITHPGHAAFDRWRERMELVCVWNWQNCVRELSSGFDAAGAHWLTPEQFPGMVSSPFFGGTFWWATAKYLLQLPPLPPPTWENRYHAEGWIGTRRPYPRIMNYLPGWP